MEEEWEIEDGEVPSSAPLPAPGVDAPPLAVAEQRAGSSAPLLTPAGSTGQTFDGSSSRNASVPGWRQEGPPDRPARDFREQPWNETGPASRDWPNAAEGHRGDWGEERSGSRGRDDRASHSDFKRWPPVSRPPGPPLRAIDYGSRREADPLASALMEGSGRWRDGPPRRETPPPQALARGAARESARPQYSRGPQQQQQRWQRPPALQGPGAASWPQAEQQRLPAAPDARFVDRDDDGDEEEEGEAPQPGSSSSSLMRDEELRRGPPGQLPSALALVASEVSSSGGSGGGSAAASGGLAVSGQSILGHGGAVALSSPPSSLLGVPGSAAALKSPGASLLGRGTAPPVAAAAGHSSHASPNSLLGSPPAMRIAASDRQPPQSGLEPGEMVVDDETHRKSSAAAVAGPWAGSSTQSHEPRTSRWAQSTLLPGGGDAVAAPAAAPRPGSRWAAQAAAQAAAPTPQPLPQPQRPEERHMPDDGELESSHGGWHLIEGQAAPALPAPLPAAAADAPQLVPPTPAQRPIPPSRFRDVESSAGHQWPESHQQQKQQQQQQHEYAQDHDMQRRRAPSDDGRSRSPPGNASRMRQPPPQQQYQQQQQQWGRPDSYDDGAWSRHWAEGGAPAAGDDRYVHAAAPAAFTHDSRRSEHRYYDDDAPDYGPDPHGTRSRGYPRDPRDTGYADAEAAWPPHHHQHQHQPLPYGHHHHGHYDQQQQQLHHYHQYPEQLHHQQLQQQHSLESGYESHWDQQQQQHLGQQRGHGSGSSGGGNYPEDERRWDGFAQSHPQHQQQLPPQPEQAPPAAPAPVDVEAEAVAELDALKERALRAPLHDVLSKPNELRIFELERALVQRTAALREARERLAVSAAVADVYAQAADRLLGLASDTSGAI